MAKYTIEQLLKSVVAQDIQSVLTAHATNTSTAAYELKLANDLRYQSKEDTIRMISAVIQTGAGTRSKSKDILEWKKTFAITFRVDASYAQNLLAVLETYCSATSNYINTVTDTRDSEPAESDITYKYYFNWGFAQKTGEPYTIDVKAETNLLGITTESRQVQIVYLSGDLYYSVGVPLEDHKVYFEIQTGTEPGPNIWASSTEAYWNAADPTERTHVTVETMNDLPAATGYAEGFALRFDFTSFPGSYGYARAEADGTVPVYEYVALLGLADPVTTLVPTFSPTVLVEKVPNVAEYDLQSVTRTKAYTVSRILGNALHDYIMRLYFTDDTATKFDINMRLTVTSLTIDNKYKAKIGNVQYNEQGMNETISFSVTIVEPLIET